MLPVSEGFILLGVGAGVGAGVGGTVCSGVAVGAGISVGEGESTVGGTAEGGGAVSSAVGNGLNSAEVGFAHPAERKNRRIKSNAMVFFMVM